MAASVHPLAQSTLFLIPARGGSKGIPGKNIKPLAGKPLIHYAIDAARALTTDEHICLSTDSDEIRAAAQTHGLHVPFLRPSELATDDASSYPVMLHALDHYAQQARAYQKLVLLQPTSPFRTAEHIRGALALFQPGDQCVLSVTESHANPYRTLYEPDSQGFLALSKQPPNGQPIRRRQEAPPAYEANGAVYVFDVTALRQQQELFYMQRIRPYVMDAQSSLDLDTPLDWQLAELILQAQTA